MRSFYCRGCGSKITKNHCPKCGYINDILNEEKSNDNKKVIKDGICGVCGKHLSKVEIKNHHCLNCNSQLINLDIKAGIGAYLMLALFVVATIYVTYEFITNIGDIIKLVGFALVIFVIIKIQQSFEVGAYDYEHSIFSKSEFYQEKHHIGKYDTNKQVLNEISKLRDEMNKRDWK